MKDITATVSVEGAVKCTGAMGRWATHGAFDDSRAPAGYAPRASVEMRTTAYRYE